MLDVKKIIYCPKCKNTEFKSQGEVSPNSISLQSGPLTQPLRILICEKCSLLFCVTRYDTDFFNS